MGVWILFYEEEGDGSLAVVFRGGGEKGRGADGAGFSPLTTTRLRVARSWAKRTQSAGYVTYAGVRFVRRVVRVLRARERPRAGVASSTRVARVFFFQNDKQKGDGYSLCSSRRFVSNRDDARLFRLSVLLVNGRSTATVIVQCVCRSSVNPFVIVFGSVVDARSRGGDI